MKFRAAVSALAFLFVSLSSCPAGAAPDDRFLAARDAAKSGDKAKLERIAPELSGYELEVYVDYWRLLLDLNNVDPAAIKSFLQRHDKSFIAEKLRSDWLRLQGRNQSWAEFDAEYPALLQPEQDLACYALQSRRARGDATMLDEAMPLWLSLMEPPEACYPVLEALILDKRVLADDVWVRIRRQFEANRLAAARYSMNYLPPSQTPDGKTALAVSDSSMAWLAKLPESAFAKRMNRELAALAISRIARSDPNMAAGQLERIESRLQAGEKGWAWSQIGWQAAQRHMSDALAWFRKAGDVPMSEEVSQWKVRAALRAHDWAAVRATIERMPPALASQPTWTYWLGRAYRAGGRLEEANHLYAKIAGQPNFYGNLADEELDRPTSVPPKAAAPTR